MRITWVSHRDIRHPGAGGVERTIFEVCKRLAAQGDSITWFSVSPTSEVDVEHASGVTLRHFGGGNLTSHVSIPLQVRLDEPDAVVDDLGHAVPWGTNVVSCRPTVAYFHHLHRRTLPGQVRPLFVPVLSAFEFTYPVLYRGCSFVTPSASAAQDLETLGVAAAHITVIPPGVDFDRFRPRPKSPTPTIVYFGGLRRYKRPELALASFGVLHSRRPDVRLAVVGEGPIKAQLLAEAKSLGIENEVSFYGRLSSDSLADLVSSAWVNLHTSASEGWCLSALEAASAGVPTVACRVPGISDSVANGVSGVLLDNPSEAELAAALSSIITEPDVWVDRCRSYALGFPWDRAAARWSEVLHSTADPESGRGRSAPKLAS